MKGYVQMARHVVSIAFCLPFAVTAFAECRFIAHGWDTFCLTPKEILASAGMLDKTPYDGVSVALPGCDRLMTSADWTVGQFADEIKTMRKFAGHRSLRDTLLFANLAPQKRLDWRDDKAWAKAASNMRTLAAIAKAGGLRGVIGDIEDYWGAKQFRHKEGDPPFDEACAVARRRGAELFRGFFDEYPDVLMLMFTFFTLDIHYFPLLDPCARMREVGDLLPSFYNGMLDVMPPGARIIDGNETSYMADAEKREFQCIAGFSRTHILPLVASENRDKYRAQVLTSLGLYLDSYTKTNKASTTYWAPKDGSRLERFRANLDQAADVADTYVWIYGERYMFVDWKISAPKTKFGFLAAPFSNGTWEDALPGVNSMMACVKDPVKWVSTTFEQERRAGRFANLVKGETVSFPLVKDAFEVNGGKATTGDYYAFKVSVPDTPDAKAIAFFKTPDGQWRLGAQTIPLRSNSKYGRKEGVAILRAATWINRIGTVGMEIKAPSVKPGEERDKVFVGIYRLRW